MVKKSKKGLSQLDWIISLSLFMVYLVWFFLYAMPAITPPTTQSASFDEVYSNFKSETEWNITEAPLVFKSNISGNNELLYLSFPYSWNSSNIGFSDQRTFVLDEGKIFFLGNITNSSNVFTIAHSDSNYSFANAFGDITSTSSSTSINSMSIKADFSGSKLAKLQREQDIPIDNMSFYINGEPFSSTTNIFSSTNVSAKYTASSQAANLSTYLFSKNYRILFFAYQNGISNTNSNNLTLSAAVRAYPYYFAHNDFTGNIDYSTATCYSVNYNSISFYGNTSGITFLLPDNSKISFCTKSDSFILNITMNLTNSTSVFQIVPFVGNYNNAVKYKSPYAAEAGMEDVMTGLSADKLAVLNASDYNTKKAAWNYRGNGNFKITVTNSTNNVLLNFGPDPKEMVNVKVFERDWWILNQYGSQEKAIVNIRMW